MSLDLGALQLGRLQRSVRHALSVLPWYRERCAEAGVSADDLVALDDLERFPFMTKADFRTHYPWGMVGVDVSKLARVHASSGTTGKPTIVAYTSNDMNVWREVVARSLQAAGGRPGDLIHNAYGYGLFTGGLGVHEGAQAASMCVIPASGGQSERQVQLIMDLRPRIITCTPSYMLALAEALERAGVDPRSTSLEIGIHGAEPWSEEMRAEIERRFEINALDIYGLSEVIGPGVAQERLDARGPLTIWEDHFFPEVVDKISGRRLGKGEEGDLVFTSLTREATPVIRYRTGDITRLHGPAGELPYRRMDRVLGRTDDMLIIRGVNLFPIQIEELVLESTTLGPHYSIDVRRDGALDTLSVTVEPNTANDAVDCALACQRLGESIKNRLGVSAEIVLATFGELSRSEGKAKRVFDHRK